MGKAWIVVATLGLLLSAYDAIDLPVRDTSSDVSSAADCPLDLMFVMTPSEGEVATIQLGDTLQANYRSFICGGTQEIDITTVWKSSDTTVATVNDGLITTLGVGTTDISVVEAEYGMGAVIKVIVSDLIP